LKPLEKLYLFLVGLLGRFGGLALGIALDDRLDDTDSNGLPHVSDGESTKRSVVSKGLNAHGLGRDHLDDGSVSRLDLGRVRLELLTRSSIDLLQELVESASDVRSVAIEHRRVTLLDLTGVVEHDDLSVEALGLLGGVVLAIRAHVTTSDVLDGDVLDVETDVVTGHTSLELGVVHLYGFDLSGDVSRGKGDDHTGLDGTSLDSADRHSSDTTDLVDVLEGKSEGLADGPLWWVDGVEGLEEGVAGLFAALFGLLAPTLVPGHVFGLLQHIVSVPARDGDEGDGLGVVTDLLDVVGDLLDDLFVSVLGVLGLGVVHLVDTNDELFDTEGEGEESVLTGLTVLGDTGFKFTDTGGDNEDGAVSLRGTGNHVLDEVTVTRGVNDGDLVLVGVELPEGNIDGDTTFSLGLELVEDPGILEGTLTHFLGFLLELFDGSLVDTTAFVDQVTGRCGFTGIDVADDHDVNMDEFLRHFGFL